MLKPNELREGDELRTEAGALAYTVVQKRHVDGGVRALVRYPDAGTDWREWPEDVADEPNPLLVRP